MVECLTTSFGSIVVTGPLSIEMPVIAYSIRLWSMLLSPWWPALSVIAMPPQFPACGWPQSATDTKTDGHDTALAAARDPLSLRLVKMALRPELPNAVRLPPLIVIGPPRGLTT